MAGLGGGWRRGALGLLLLAACAEDRILPVAGSVDCGDGQVTEGETCDNDSEGCVQCQVEQGWACPDNVCSPICGDGLVKGDEECDSDDDPNCDSACRTGERPAQNCDMTGWWAIRQTDFIIDNVVSELQTSSTYYLDEFVQNGDTFTTRTALHCGVVVSGSADVNLTEDGLRALIYENPHANHPTQGARSGVSRQVENACDFSFERWYSVRGLELSYLPADFRANPELQTLVPLPVESDPENPGPTPEGAEDWDGDGLPGLRWLLTGNARGARSTVQRDWSEMLPDPEGELVPLPGQLEFLSYNRFNTQENIMALPDCPPIGCGIVGASGGPSLTSRGRSSFRYLGQSLDDPRVAAMVVGPPTESLEDDMETCRRLRESLPHLDSRDLGVSLDE